jgi:hypothetical protein
MNMTDITIKKNDEEDTWIPVNEKLDLSRTIYIVNNSRSIKTFDDGKGQIARLASPGTPASSQVLEEFMIHTPFFVSLRRSNKIKLTYSNDFDNVAISAIDLKNQKEEAELEKLKASVQSSDEVYGTTDISDEVNSDPDLQF